MASRTVRQAMWYSSASDFIEVTAARLSSSSAEGEERTMQMNINDDNYGRLSVKRMILEGRGDNQILDWLRGKGYRGVAGFIGKMRCQVQDGNTRA